MRAPARSFTSLDVLNLSELFESRPRLMRSVPHILRGGFRLALRVAFQEILAGAEINSEARAVKGWKLFENVALEAETRRHSFLKEVGGEDQAIPGRQLDLPSSLEHCRFRAGQNRAVR